MRTNVIDSQILCLSLIRFIDAKFSQDAIFDRFSYENILSAAFEEGDPYGARKEKSFDEVLVTAKKILDEAIQPGEVITINWRLFVRSLQDITELRVQNNLKNSESKQSDQQNAYVIFVNKKELWD